jgi:hypothetical protein
LMTRRPPLGERLPPCRGRGGAAVLLATQDLAFAERVCDQLFLIHNGRLVADGSPALLREHYRADSVEEAFLTATGIGRRIDDFEQRLETFRANARCLVRRLRPVARTNPLLTVLAVLAPAALLIGLAWTGSRGAQTLAAFSGGDRAFGSRRVRHRGFQRAARVLGRQVAGRPDPGCAALEGFLFWGW